MQGQGFIYVLHFLTAPSGPCTGHYVGATRSPARRLAEHAAGGSKATRERGSFVVGSITLVDELSIALEKKVAADAESWCQLCGGVAPAIDLGEIWELRAALPWAYPAANRRLKL